MKQKILNLFKRSHDDTLFITVDELKTLGDKTPDEIKKHLEILKDNEKQYLLNHALGSACAAANLPAVKNLLEAGAKKPRRHDIQP